MAIVVTDNGGATNVSGTTLAKTAVTVAAGSLIVVRSAETGTTLGTVTDSAGNTYTAITSVHPGGGVSTGTTGLFYCKNCLALSSGTVTFHKTASGNCAIAVMSATGIDTVAPLDTAVTNTATGSSAAPSVTSGSPAVSGELFVAVADWATSSRTGTQDTGDGWAAPPVAQTLDIGGNQVNAGTGTLTYAPTLSGTSVWGAIIVAFKPPTIPAQSWDQGFLPQALKPLFKAAEFWDGNPVAPAAAVTPLTSLSFDLFDQPRRKPTPDPWSSFISAAASAAPVIRTSFDLFPPVLQKRRLPDNWDAPRTAAPIRIPGDRFFDHIRPKKPSPWNWDVPGTLPPVLIVGDRFFDPLRPLKAAPHWNTAPSPASAVQVTVTFDPQSFFQHSPPPAFKAVPLGFAFLPFGTPGPAVSNLPWQRWRWDPTWDYGR